MSGRKASNREKLWKLGRRKVMEAFIMGRWGVRNENRAWRGLNRLFSDHWFLHRLLEFAQGLWNFSKLAKWISTPSLILQTFRKAGCAKFSQGVRISFCRVCEIFAPLEKWYLGFSQALRIFHRVCEMLCFSGFFSARKFLRFFPSVLKSTYNWPSKIKLNRNKIKFKQKITIKISTKSIKL